jgi:hypothetical protein
MSLTLNTSSSLARPVLCFERGLIGRKKLFRIVEDGCKVICKKNGLYSLTLNLTVDRNCIVKFRRDPKLSSRYRHFYKFRCEKGQNTRLTTLPLIAGKPFWVEIYAYSPVQVSQATLRINFLERLTS